MTSVGTIKVDFGGDSTAVEKAFERMRQALGKTEAATEKMQRALLKTDHASLVVDNFGNRLKKVGDDGAAAMNKLTPAAERATAKVRELDSTMARSSSGGRDLGRAALEASRGFEDMQYGLKGVLNNIPSLISSLGGGPGLAGAVSMAAVSVSILYDWWNRERVAAAAAAKESVKAANDIVDALKRRTQADDLAFTKSLFGIKDDDVAKVRQLSAEVATLELELRASGKLGAPGFIEGIFEEGKFGAARDKLQELRKALSEARAELKTAQRLEGFSGVGTKADRDAEAKEAAKGIRDSRRETESLAKKEERYWEKIVKHWGDLARSAEEFWSSAPNTSDISAMMQTPKREIGGGLGEAARIAADKAANDSLEADISAGAARAALRDRSADTDRLIAETSKEIAAAASARLDSGAQSAIGSLVNGDVQSAGAALGAAAGIPMAGLLAEVLGNALSAVTSGLNRVVDRVMQSRGGAALRETGESAKALMPLMGVGGILLAPLVFISAIIGASTHTQRFATFAEVAGKGLDLLIEPLGFVWQQLMPLAGSIVAFARATAPLTTAILSLMPIEGLGKTLFETFKNLAWAGLSLVGVFSSAAYMLLKLVDDVLPGAQFRDEQAGMRAAATAAFDAAFEVGITSWEAARQEANNTAADLRGLGDAASEFGQELTNIPTGYRIPFYDSETPNGRGGGDAGGIPREGLTQTATQFTGCTFHIVAASPAIADEIRKQTMASRGKPMHLPRGTNPGRSN